MDISITIDEDTQRILPNQKKLKTDPCLKHEEPLPFILDREPFPGAVGRTFRLVEAKPYETSTPPARAEEKQTPSKLDEAIEGVDKALRSFVQNLRKTQATPPADECMSMTMDYSKAEERQKADARVRMAEVAARRQVATIKVTDDVKAIASWMERAGEGSCLGAGGFRLTRTRDEFVVEGQNVSMRYGDATRAAWRFIQAAGDGNVYVMTYRTI